MVWQRLETLRTQPAGDALRFLARQAIDDPGRAAMCLQELQQLRPGVGFHLHCIADVRPVKWRDESCGLMKFEPIDDFLPRLIRCCRCYRHARDAGEQTAKVTQSEVVTAKIMAPLRNTVRLVNGNH